MNGKTIRIHLVNGSPLDILTAEIINWIGKVIVAPRSFKGSTARVVGPPGWTSYRGLREQLVLEKKLAPCDSLDFYVFAENVPFSSPTAGAVVVNAGNVSGRTGSWRLEGTNKTYQDWHEEKLAAAGGQLEAS